MRGLLIGFALLAAGLLVGVAVGRGAAAPGDADLPAHEVVAVLQDADFASTDSDAVQVVRTQIEGHDVWVAVGYQKIGIAHHPDCRLCADMASKAPAN
jgi:hypothetical protein